MQRFTISLSVAVLLGLVTA